MYDNVLLAVALQRWDHYSAHALAARTVAGALARPAGRLHVLTVSRIETKNLPTGLPADMVGRLRDQQIREAEAFITQKMDEFVAPLVAQGLAVARLVREGSPRHVIIEVAQELAADVIVIGSHSKRGLLDIALGGTARHVSTHAPCTVVMAAPKK